MFKDDNVILVQVAVTVGDIKRMLEKREIVINDGNIKKVLAILQTKGWKNNGIKESNKFIDKWIDQMVEEKILIIAEQTRGGGD